MKRNLVNFRLPEDLIEAIAIRAEEQGISKTELLETFVRQGLGLPVNHYVRQDSFTVRQDSFTDVNQDTESVKQLVNQAVAEAITPLKARIEALEAKTKAGHVVEAIAPSQKTTEAVEAIAPNPSQGITQTELCRRFGIDASNLSKRAKKAGMTSEEFLSRETGWRKQGRFWYQGS